MTRVIYKYVLDFEHGGQHAIPEGSVFLSLQMQHGYPVMWWSVPYDQIPKTSHTADEARTIRRAWPLRTFTIVPTGGAGYLDHLHYVGTFQGDRIVGHVFSWEPVPREIAR